MKKILKKLADMCTDYTSYTDVYNNTPVGSNDLERMKEETINTIGELLREIIDSDDEIENVKEDNRRDTL